MSEWTTERVDMAHKLFLDGLSASQIAGEVGGCTRSAIIGLAHRRGWKSPNARTHRVGAAPAQRRARPLNREKIKALTNHGNRFDVVERYAPHPIEPAPVALIIPLGQRCTLLDLTSQKCRWPIGDPGTPEFFFCGGSPVEDCPYCSYHARVAYQPAVDRRRSHPALKR